MVLGRTVKGALFLYLLKKNMKEDFNESKFDAITLIEKELMLRGYERHYFDFKKKEMVKMLPKGDSSYYFSTMKHLSFCYKKQDFIFEVGLHSGHPQLFHSRPYPIINEMPFILIDTHCIIVNRILDYIGHSKFIDNVESKKNMDIPDLQKWINEWLESLTPKKIENIEKGYTYESNTCAF